MDGSSANVLFQVTAFSKCYNGKRWVEVILQLWFACFFIANFDMYQSFVRTSFKLGNAQLYVTDNGAHCLS